MADSTFRIVWSEHHREAVRELGQKAGKLGLRAPFLKDLKRIIQNLALEALTWGDPQYELSSAGLTVRHGIQGILHIYYGVDEERSLVYVKEILPLPGQGFD